MSAIGGYLTRFRILSASSRSIESNSDNERPSLLEQQQQQHGWNENGVGHERVYRFYAVSGKPLAATTTRSVGRRRRRRDDTPLPYRQ